MTDVVLTAVPLKQTMEIDFAKKMATHGRMKKMNARLLDDVSMARKKLVRAMTQGIETGEDGYLELAKTYLGMVRGMTADSPADRCRKSIFFFWGPSIGRKTSHATDEMAYDMASVLLNLAILEMRKAVDDIQLAGRASAERIEKECYRTMASAAGKFQAAYSAMGEVSVTKDFPLDANRDVIEGLKFLCLAQAQELALSKAVRDPNNKGRVLLAKLASQGAVLYQSTVDAFVAHKEGCDDPYFLKLAQFAEFKALYMRIHAHHLQILHCSGSKEDMNAQAREAYKQSGEMLKEMQTTFKRGYACGAHTLPLPRPQTTPVVQA